MEDPSLRSRTMRAVKSKNTALEVRIRHLLHAQGFRFRLHDRSLPGTPDIVFPARKKAVLVHGCFWHGHSCPRGNRIPKNNSAYWSNKIARNVTRDRETIKHLQQLGWQSAIVWECELRTDVDALLYRLTNFLGSTKHISKHASSIE